MDEEAALRDWVAKHSTRFSKLPGDVQEQIWQEVQEDDFVGSALDPDLPNAKDELLKKVELTIDRRKSWRGRPSPPGRSRRKESIPILRLNKNENARAEAFSICLAEHATASPPVRRFRKNILQGMVLSQEKALALLTSPAAQVMSAEGFAELGIPILEHHATIVSPLTRSSGVDPTNGKWWVEKEEVTLRITWPNGELESPFRRGYQFWGVQHLPWVTLEYRDTEGAHRRIKAWPGTVLGKFSMLVEELTKRYSWTSVESTMFVLTDVLPLIVPLHVSASQSLRIQTSQYENPCSENEGAWPLVMTRQRITLIVDAWVSDNTVQRVYKAAQHEMLKRDNRQLGERTLALVRFLAELKNYEKMTWDERMVAWNRVQTTPTWQYNDVRHFQEACSRAEQAILSPDISLQEGQRSLRQSRKLQHQRLHKAGEC